MNINKKKKSNIRTLLHLRKIEHLLKKNKVYNLEEVENTYFWGKTGVAVVAITWRHNIDKYNSIK